MGSDRSFGVSEIRNHFSYGEVRTEEDLFMMLNEDVISLWAGMGWKHIARPLFSLVLFEKMCNNIVIPVNSA